jgi:hypothetical protein
VDERVNLNRIQIVSDLMKMTVINKMEFDWVSNVDLVVWRIRYRLTGVNSDLSVRVTCAFAQMISDEKGIVASHHLEFSRSVLIWWNDVTATTGRRLTIFRQRGFFSQVHWIKIDGLSVTTVIRLSCSPWTTIILLGKGSRKLAVQRNFKTWCSPSQSELLYMRTSSNIQNKKKTKFPLKKKIH